jgi:ABC-type glycerol-3-phosphate transport system substrate-binding protein
MSEPRRLFALAIAAALVLSACGGSQSSSDSQADQPAEQTETPAADIVISGPTP